MKIFITGKNGFIAQHLLKHLLNDGHTIETSSKEDDITLKLNNFSPDIIIHLAAELYDADKMVESNIILTHNILEYSRKNPLQKLYLVGSSSEYGRKTAPMKETDILEPRTIYEGTKACATLLAQAYSYSYNIPVTVIRPFSVYGPGEKSNKFLQIVFSKKLRYVNNANHDWIYIDDFIDAFITIMNYKETSLFNIINIGNGIQYTNQTILNIAENIMNYKFEYIIQDIGKVYDSLNWVSDPTLLNQKYGFYPKYTIEEGIKKYYEEFKKDLISEQT
jgi:nucleoside-diphosphate-sugar epimerase